MDVTADQALAAAGADLKDPGAKKRALEFLQEILANGPVNAKEAEEEAEANGISERTLRRARMTLGIKVAKDGYQGPWMWKLP